MVLALVVLAYRWRSSAVLSQRLTRWLRSKSMSELSSHRRTFPYHVAPDAQRGVEQWLSGRVSQQLGVPTSGGFMEETSLSDLMAPSLWGPGPSTLEYDAFDAGDEEPVSCVRNSLWLVDDQGAHYVILWTSNTTYSGCGARRQLNLEFCGREGAEEAAKDFFRTVEAAIRQLQTYRGKVLSFEQGDDYEGATSGIKVHQLREVRREQVILPEATVALLERNVIRFARQREQLARHGMPVKKGLLLYGPPGVGKTHTLHYLFGVLKDHTTLLITAEQIGQLDEYATLARLVQPAIVVLEDVDLVALSREEASVGQQSLLNRLLNEMDGLNADSEVIFLLTTNRPEALEAALASRPGRIDQAIEFPLPDAEGRRKLVELYAGAATIEAPVLADLVRRTEGVSASFIKELMRRSVQFHLECDPETQQATLSQNDVDQALDELLFAGGSLNRSLLGGGGEDPL